MGATLRTTLTHRHVHTSAYHTRVYTLSFTLSFTHTTCPHIFRFTEPDINKSVLPGIHMFSNAHGTYTGTWDSNMHMRLNTRDGSSYLSNTITKSSICSYCLTHLHMDKMSARNQDPHSTSWYCLTHPHRYPQLTHHGVVCFDR